jgi:hypothetical protein
MVVLQSPKSPEFVPDHTQLERSRRNLQGDGCLCRNVQAGDKSDSASVAGTKKHISPPFGMLAMSL